MTLKSHAEFEEKLTCRLENDTRNLANFHQNIWKFQNWYSHGIILSKVENAWAKASQRSYVLWHWRFMKNLKRNWFVVSKFHDTREWCKIWRKVTFGLENDVKNLANFHLNTQSLKIGTFIGPFYPK